MQEEASGLIILVQLRIPTHLARTRYSCAMDAHVAFAQLIGQLARQAAVLVLLDTLVRSFRIFLQPFLCKRFNLIREHCAWSQFENKGDATLLFLLFHIIARHR